MISTASLSTLGAAIAPPRDPAIRLVDQAARVASPSAATQAGGVSRLGQPPAPVPSPGRGGRGALLDLSV